ncbi:hypothetical protein GJ688_11595, partial [Heliobacillus mobilis]
MNKKLACAALTTSFLFTSVSAAFAVPTGLYFNGKYYSDEYLDQNSDSLKSILSSAKRSSKAFYISEDEHSYTLYKDYTGEKTKYNLDLNKKNPLDLFYIDAETSDKILGVVFKTGTVSEDNGSVLLTADRNMTYPKVTDFTFDKGVKVKSVTTLPNNQIRLITSGLSESETYSLSYKNVDTGIKVTGLVQPIKMNQLVAKDDTLSIQFNKAPEMAPEVSNFTVYQKINKGQEQLITPDSFVWDESTLTATLQVPSVKQTQDVQVLRYSVFYNEMKLASNTLTIKAIPKIASVQATDGFVTVKLTDSPKTAPIIDEFTLTQKIGSKKAEALSGELVSWDSKSKTALISFDPLLSSESSTKVVIGVQYGLSKKDNFFWTVPSTSEVQTVSIVNASNRKELVVGSESESSLTLSAIALDKSKKVIPGKSATWDSLDSKIATVNSSGVVTAVSAGTTSITATIGGKTASFPIVVKEMDQSTATVSPSSTTPTQNQAFTLNITGAKGTDGQALVGAVDVQVTSSNTAEGTTGVIFNDAITFTAGAATIPVILAQTGSQTLTVKIAGVTAAKTANVTVAASSFSAATDSTTANDVPTLGLVGTTATSGTPSVATAAVNSGTGKIDITSVSAGTATITVEDASNHQATIAVTVGPDGAITVGTITKYTVVFSAATDSTTANDLSTLGLVGTTATSGTPSVATAAVNSGTGKIDITSVSAGTATITVEDASNHQATIAVTVGPDGAITVG